MSNEEASQSLSQSESVLCKNCGGPIVWSRFKWRHDTLEMDRGCYAASFKRGQGWDPDLKRSWRATPPKGVTPPSDRDDLTVYDAELGHMAMVIAMAVRNGLEELHGGDVRESLTDNQMRRINPIVRDSIYTMLKAYLRDDNDPRLELYRRFNAQFPHYWERPKIVDDVLASRATVESIATYGQMRK